MSSSMPSSNEWFYVEFRVLCYEGIRMGHNYFISILEYENDEYIQTNIRMHRWLRNRSELPEGSRTEIVRYATVIYYFN